MSDLLYLGRPAFDPKPFTRLEPVAQAMDGGWQVYQDFTEALPKEGRVFAPRLPGFSSRSLLAFSAEPISKNDQERDLYILAQPWGIQEVLDFRSIEVEAARRQLVELGLQQLLFGTDVIVAALSDGTCTVVKMVRHPADSRWVADIDGLEHLEVRSFDSPVCSRRRYV